MSEEVITFNVVYNVQNIDNSIRQTQRMLLFTNALRLSIVDIQRVMSGPTIANVLFTGIQLTRVWTTLLRLIKASNAEQAKSFLLGGTGALRGGSAGAVGAAARRFAGGQQLLAPFPASISLLDKLLAFAAIGGGVPILGTAAVVAGVTFIGLTRRSRGIQRKWRERQRDIARGQGLVY